MPYIILALAIGFKTASNSFANSAPTWWQGERGYNIFDYGKFYLTMVRYVWLLYSNNFFFVQ